MSSILITGASSGIGLQLAFDYAREGHQVIACGRSQEKLDANFAGTSIQTLCFDTTNKQAVLTAARDVGHLTMLILNAGSCEYIDDVMNFDSDLFSRVVQTNLIGTAYCLEGFLNKLSAGGTLAFMSSSATMLPFARAEAYGASKAGIDYLAESMAVDLYRHKIAVCNIKPCFVDTPLTKKNTFAMPGSINTQQASQYIRKGLAKQKPIISFTSWFIFGLKMLQWLPRRWLQIIQTKENA